MSSRLPPPKMFGLHIEQTDYGRNVRIWYVRRDKDRSYVGHDFEPARDSDAVVARKLRELADAIEKGAAP